MNIDIRNIDSDFESAIKEIIKTQWDINTASKAVRYAAINYIKSLEEIEELENVIEQLKKQVENEKQLNSKYATYFQLQKELFLIALLELIRLVAKYY